MSDEPETPSPDSSPPYDPTRRVSTGLAGETTGSYLGPTVTPRSDGGTLLPSSAPMREVIGDFEVLAKLGQGGMGAVYRARQISLDRQVALKILPAAFEADADFVSRFQREARVAASLNHGNLVKVYAAGQADGCHFIAMELIEGETLGDWLKRGPLPPLEALRICADVAHALAHGWQRAQLIHRDIKPGNIFLSIHGDVKVGDLGLAKTLGGDTTGLTQTGTAMGTPHYISPEQARGDRDIDFRADLYSLGCTLYQMLTGRTPYEGRDPVVVLNQHINAPPPAILKVMPACPIPLARLVGRMLKKVRRERHASYEELLANIESVRALFDPSLSFTPPPPAPDPAATLLQTPATGVVGRVSPPAGFTPAGARAVTGGDTGPTRGTASKSKTPLYAAFAAVGIMAVVAILAWPKKEKLTKAELYAQQRAAEQATSAESGGTSSGASRISAPSNSGGQERAGAHPAERARAAEPTPIRLWDTADKLPKQPGISWEDGALRLDGKPVRHNEPRSRDAILRASIRMNAEASSPSIGLRNDDRKPGGSFFQLQVDVPARTFRLMAVDGGQGTRIGAWPFPKTYGPADWMRLELKMVGEQITVTVDGEKLGTATDNSRLEPGGVVLFATANGYFRDIEYAPLDAATAAPDVWRDWVAEKRAAGNFRGNPSFADDGSQVRAQVGANAVWHEAGAFRNGRVRATWTIPTGKEALLNFRCELKSGSYTRCYQAAVGKGGVKLQVYDRTNGDSWKVLRQWPTPAGFDPAKEYTLEASFIGSSFTISLDGKEIGSVDDQTLPGPGGLSLSLPTDALVRSFEFQSLDGATASTTLSAPAGWQPLMPSAEWQKTVPSKREFANGALHLLDNGATRSLPFADGALRATIQIRDKTERPSVQARWVWGKGGYRAVLGGQNDEIYLNRYDGGNGVNLGRYKLSAALRSGDQITIEVGIVGPHLTVVVNGQSVIEANDETYKDSGDWGVYAFDGWFESAEYQPLQPAPER